MPTIDDVRTALQRDDHAEALDLLLAVDDDPAQPEYALRWYMQRPRGAEVPLSIGLPRHLPSAMQWTREAWEADAGRRCSFQKGHTDTTVYRIRVIDLANEGRTVASVNWQVGIGQNPDNTEPKRQDAVSAPASYPLGYPMAPVYGGQRSGVDIEALIAKASESTAQKVLAGVESRIAALEKRLDDDDDDDDDQPRMSEDGLIVMSVLQSLPADDPNAEALNTIVRGLKVAESFVGPRPLFHRIGRALEVWQAGTTGNRVLTAPQAPQQAAPQATTQTIDVSRIVKNLADAGIPDGEALLHELANNPSAVKAIVSSAKTD